MKNILEVLFLAFNDKRKISNYERSLSKSIEKNSALLRTRLSKKERRLLLAIIDNEDLLLEEASIRNFTAGFKLGVKLGIELEK